MKVHFISIGGSVMHQLAIALHKKGYIVTGTDDEIFEPALTNLKQEGLLPGTPGWQPALITKEIDAVILGMHAKADNPELAEAQALHLNIYSFPEYIYQESQLKKRIVVGGSHGKTTTTAMIMHVCKQLELEFDYLVGAKLEGFSQSVKISDAPIIICEGDEYPASTIERNPKFHFLFPHVAILTGIAWDHINVFPSFEIYVEQFRIFIQKIENNGLLIYNSTDRELTKLIAENKRLDIRYQPYGIPTHTIVDGKTVVTIENITASLSIFGNHNLLNLNAAFYVCKDLGIEAKEFLPAIANFTGAAKRLELMASNSQTNIYRDFAHAPSKVAASVQAVHEQFPSRKLIAILELHTFSSLNEAFIHQYQGALDLADEAVVFYSNHALALKRLPNLPSDIVQKGFNKSGLLVITDKEILWNWLQKQNYAHTNLLLMSSGNYDGLDMLTLAKQITQ